MTELSGTIAVEAALWASNFAPGYSYEYAKIGLPDTSVSPVQYTVSPSPLNESIGES